MCNFLASLINNIIFSKRRLIFVYGLDTSGGELPSVQYSLYCYWQLIYFRFTLIPLVLPLRSLWFFFFFFNQRPFSFSDFWFFPLNPVRPLKTLLDLLSFLTPISLLESAVPLKGKKRPQAWVNFSHLLSFSPSIFSLWVISWGSRRDSKIYFVQFIEVSNNLDYYFWIWDSI